MKKILSHFFIAFLLATLFSAFIYSQEAPVFLFSINSRNIARVGVINSTPKPAKFYIKNLEKEKVISRVIKENIDLFEFFDLSKLPDGLYTAYIDRDDQLSKKFIVSKGKFNMYEKSGIEPRFHLTDDNILFLNFFNKDSHNITIMIEEGGNVLLTDKCSDKQIAKKYSLKQLLPGRYNIKVIAGFEEYNHTINL